MIDQIKLANLRQIAKPNVCEVLAVYWSNTQTNYYSWARYDDLIQFSDIPLKPIEARLLSNGFHQFEINGDVRTENISLTFDDLDKDITAKFRDFGTVRCELFYYYAEADLLISVWWGQLNKPDIFGRKTIQTTASNGFRSRELQLPRRTRPKHCTAIFGGKFTNHDELYTNGCPYDRQIAGGTTGLLDPATNQPFTDCPRLTEADCNARFGHDDYFLGFNVRANPTPSGSGFIATSRNNASNLKQPIRVVFGRKHVRNLPCLAWRVESADYIRGLWEVGEGVCLEVKNITLNGQAPQTISLWVPNGGRGQSGTGYDQTLNFSGTTFFTALFGTPNGKAAQNTTGDKIEVVCAVHGYAEIAVYSSPTAYTRAFTTNAAWILLECHTNQRFGLGYAPARFDIASFMETGAWCAARVAFTHPNGTVYTSTGEGRGAFSAVLEGRPSHEQITDICRSMRLSIPFQQDGKYHVRPIAAVSQETLDAARVFTDRGDEKNIIWADGMPSISFSQVGDEKLCNHVVVTYEEADNLDLERPITVDDPDQKARAGKALGDNNFSEIPKRYAGFGIRTLADAIRLGFSLLWFGEFDTGGLKNNLRGVFTVPFEQTLNLKKYDIIKIESDLLDGFVSPEGNPFTCFRLLNLRKIAGGAVELTAQAYNREVYENFEAVLPPSNDFIADGEQLDVRRLTFGDAPVYQNGSIVIPPITQI